jgi:hypothetical protein
MRRVLTILLSVFVFLLQGQSDLVITGVIDGPLSGGLPKAVEIYVINDISDLSVYGVGCANNGGGSDGIEFTFPADAVSAGDFIYLATETSQFNSFFGFNPDYTDGDATGTNGDDAIELFKNNNLVDVFGDPDTDGTGEVWDYLDGWVYSNNDREPSSTFNVVDWTLSGINALDGETTNDNAETPFPDGTYSYALPVELLNFDAKLNKNRTVNISWNISEEFNHNYFSLEYSSDGSFFIQISKEIDSNQNSYFYTHKNPKTGFNYYRLIQVDFDGRKTIFPTKAIYIDSKSDGFNILPNSVSNSLKVSFHQPVQNGRLQIFNSSGQMVMNLLLSSGIDVLNTDVSELLPGQYLVRYVHAGGMETGRFVKI